MKKIYMILAVFALLSMSLNAQTKVEIIPDGYFRMGPSRVSTTPVTPPYSNSFDSSTDFDWWETINANNDDYTWAYSSNAAQIRWNSSKAADDWLVTAPVYLEAGKNYKFYIDTWEGTTTYGSERMEVKMASANTATALSAGTSIIASTDVSWTSSQTLSNLNVTVSSTGNYYFGIHGISDADIYYLYVDNFVIDVDITDPTITASPTSVSMSTTPGGTATETVAVTGLNLTDGITYTLTDANNVFSVSPASLGTTGGTLTITYSPTAAGNHTATLVLNSTGADPVTITLNGSCVAGTVYELVTDPSTQLVDGKEYILVAKNNQYAMGALSGTSGYGTAIAITDNGNGTVTVPGTASPMVLTLHNYSSNYTSGYTFTLANGSYLRPYASNNTNLTTATASSDNNCWTTVADVKSTGGYGLKNYLSTSRALGFQESTSVTARFAYYGTNNLTATSTTYYYALLYKKVEADQHDLGITLSEPTAVTAGENATITATVTNNGNQTESGYTVTFSDGTNTFSTQTGGTLNPGDTQTFTATYATSAAGTVTITATVACTGDADATNDVATTNLTVNAPVHDLGITLSAPAEVVGGNAATVTATVTNNGDYTETGYTVTIYADGTAISTPTAVSLAPGASTTFTVDYATTSAQVGTTVNFTATVACTGDADATNNSAAASTAVITLPPPINVVAVPDNTNMSATVTWDAPVIAPVVETVVEDFEDTSVFPTFTTGGVNANTRTGAFGSWTLYDGNGSNVYGMSDVDFGTDVEGTPYAWMPFDLTATTPVWSVTNISAHSGTQFMNSVSARQTTTNHWLISPELSGNAQTISWYDAEMKTNWGAESYEVLYSTTDNTAPSSFTSLGTYSADALTWGTAETANLPAGAKYFAIRHTQNDGFGLMIDDVTYEGLVPGVQPISYKVYLDGVLQGTVNAGDPLTYPLTNLTGGQHTVEVSAVYPGNIESTKTPYQFTITAKTATPTISGQVDPNNENNYVITATGNGTVTLTVGNETVSGNGSASITVPRSDVNQTVTATATAQESGKEVSDPATETFTVPLMQTATPVISTSSDGESVTITATGNGTVTLTVGNQTVSGPGSASITIPCGVTGTTVTATATAQETGKAVSETATQQVPIPAGEGWTQMDGTYDNPNTLLSFEKDGEEIMLIDQFLASTYNNAHPGGYDYTIMETVENEDKVSPPVHIPVYKTNSSIQGLYTKNQVDADTLMNYRADVLNTEMDYDVNPGEHTYFYGLYRSDLNADYPDVDIPHRISQLQKYDEIVGEHVQFFFTETYNSGIAPMYDGIGSQMVERLDLNYVEGELNDSLAYVPVIWTFGLYTARGDGKNNSYGSDIKREKLGGVDINFIEGTLSTNNTTHPNDYGMWEAPNGVQYCVYTPYMRVTGIKPVSYIANDGDEVTYEPYMYRVWCIYPDARDFARDNRVLVDNGALPDTMLLETVYVTDPTVNSVFFGKEQWVEADGKLPYAFGVPVSVADNPSALEFVIRFYYKKSVDEGNGAKGQRDGDDEEYFIVENRGNGQDIGTAINEMFFDQLHGEIVGVTYVNTLGMQSDKPFDGINIVVTRYSDGTTSTSKVRY